jgi:hypothetical protein
MIVRAVDAAGDRELLFPGARALDPVEREALDEHAANKTMIPRMTDVLGMPCRGRPRVGLPGRV